MRTRSRPGPRPLTPRLPRFTPARAALFLALLALFGPTARADGTISALGRLEPAGGVIRVAGPSHAAVVLTELRVEVGQVLKKGDIIARLDSYARHRANVDAKLAFLEDAQRELARSQKLQVGRAASAATRDTAEMEVKVARANLAGAQAELALAEVRAPIEGQVLRIHAREGERVDHEGIIELGRTNEMHAIAEVYETDIGRVREGQVATIKSPALPEPLTGRVERIGLTVSKMDVLDTDPVAKTDARVVEVDVRLDAHVDASKLTYLQVRIEIDPNTPAASE